MKLRSFECLLKLYNFDVEFVASRKKADGSCDNCGRVGLKLWTSSNGDQPLWCKRCIKELHTKNLMKISLAAMNVERGHTIQCATLIAWHDEKNCTCKKEDGCDDGHMFNWEDDPPAEDGTYLYSGILSGGHIYLGSVTIYTEQIKRDYEPQYNLRMVYVVFPPQGGWKGFEMIRSPIEEWEGKWAKPVFWVNAKQEPPFFIKKKDLA